MLRCVTEGDFRAEFLQAGRGPGRDPSVDRRVQRIISRVREEGDPAVCEYTQMFDGVSDPAPSGLAVNEDVIAEGLRSTSTELIDAMKLAVENLRRFHSREKAGSWWVANENASFSGQRVLPVNTAGIYVPGGRAAYPSSLLMGAVPAQIAGVGQLVVCSPPGPDGEVNRLVLAAAALLGIDRVYRIGGAQAIAAMAFGTQSVPKADIVCGPGNRYVTAAKRLVYGAVDIDSLAGPSELAVVADETANCVTVAADMLAQAEHDPESAVFLFTTCESVARRVAAEIRRQVADLPRETIICEALGHRSAAVVADGDRSLWGMVNELAPEHLSIRTADAVEKIGEVRSAGAVFAGEMSAVAFGDYTAGVNHVLPTAGTAHFASPLGVESFIKRSNVLYISADEFHRLAGPTEVFAEAEGLTAHARSIALRQDDEC